jgi:Flp pilus assembly protein TadD
MARSHRFGTALSLVAMTAALGGCAMAGHRSTESASSTNKGDLANVGLAIRAQAALNSKNYAAAVDFAERAVAFKPENAAYRAVLGNAYFAAGRFGSAETSFKDSLRLQSNQPDVVLKLVLVTIAQGRNSEALSFLEAGRNVIDPGNYGLALALAGQPDDAISSLEQAARRPEASPRVRQNLALAYALAGQWDAARTVVAQDVPANLVDARIHQWMTFASPTHASDQVASLVGVVPAAIDPGQPVQLALRQSGDTRLAAAAPIAPAAPSEVSSVAPVAPAAAPALAFADPIAPAAAPEPVFVAPVAEEEAPPPPMPPARKVAPMRAASFVPDAAPLRPAVASKPLASSTSVVQLGAYSSRDRVQVAWNRLSSRFDMVRNFTPVSARFEGSKGTFYRLSVKGFESQSEAIALCRDVCSAGGKCFVRTVAGDHPVRFASR